MCIGIEVRKWGQADMDSTCTCPRCTYYRLWHEINAIVYKSKLQAESYLLDPIDVIIQKLVGTPHYPSAEEFEVFIRTDWYGSPHRDTILKAKLMKHGYI